MRFVKKVGCFFFAAGILLIAVTFLFHITIKRENMRAASVYETKLLLKGQYLKGEDLENVATHQRLPENDLWDESDVLGVLSIPSISCKELIKEGSVTLLPTNALGHIKGTALPGKNGNCVIAGHRNYSFGIYFNRLDEVKIGDEIKIITEEGTFIYIVTKTQVVEPEEIWILDNTEEARLTLFTCTPIYIATHRLVVVAALQNEVSY